MRVWPRHDASRRLRLASSAKRLPIRSRLTRLVVVLLLLLLVARWQHLQSLNNSNSSGLSVTRLDAQLTISTARGPRGNANAAPLPDSWSVPKALFWSPPLTANDSTGCYPRAAGEHISVRQARDLTVNVTHFSHIFKDWFIFDHTPDSWAAMSGSGVWLDSQQVYVTSTRMMLKPQDCKSPCQLAKESFVYLQAWDADFRPTQLRYRVGEDYMLGIPIEGRVARIYDVSGGDWWRGPEDARMHSDDYGNLIMTFNMGDTHSRQYWTYNVTDGNLLKLKTLDEEGRWEKNWAPVVLGGDLHFIYSFDPLRLLHCSNRGTGCSFVVGRDTQGIAGLRGGTPFVRYGNTHYYVGFPRTAHNCHCGRFYRPHIAILYAPPLMLNDTVESNEIDYGRVDLVYISEPIDFHRVALQPPYTPPNPPEICGSYLLPCGFLRWDLADPHAAPGSNATVDRAFIEVSVQDSANVVIEFSGLEAIVANAIHAEEQRVNQLYDKERPWEPVAQQQVKCSKTAMEAQCPPAPTETEPAPPQETVAT
ncbi:Beta-mannosyltransferase 1 [Sorochytrium milnesiophthora]